MTTYCHLRVVGGANRDLWFRSRGNPRGRTRASRTLQHFASLLLVLLFSAGAALGTELSDYGRRIHEAAIELNSVIQWRKSEGAVKYQQLASEAMANLRKNFPSTETIDWDGSRLNIDNSWIEKTIAEFEALPAFDDHGAQIIERMAERFRAMEERLGELMEVEATDSQPSAKDQEKAKLEAILRRAEFNRNPYEKSVLERIWETIKRWWNNLFGGGRGLGGTGTSWFSLIALILVFTAAAAALGFGIWKLAIYWEKRRGAIKREKRKARIVLGERLSPDQTGADLLAEAEALARRGEIRAAIRKAYIALLCELGDRKVISLAEYKTNRDYLRAVRETRPLLNEMQKLTNSFENHWYGFRPATADDWTGFVSGYQRALKTVVEK